jgi:hypothetical protein
MEDDGILYRHLVNFTVLCYILWAFGIVRGNLVYFFPFWYIVPRKIWQPWFQCRYKTNRQLYWLRGAISAWEHMYGLRDQIRLGCIGWWF